MFKRIRTLAEQLHTMYVTESPVNYNAALRCKKNYCLCFRGTNKIISSFRTQTELEECILDGLEYGIPVNGQTFY